jgi:ElaB/YqjD/DUF883 family membrane-anchored ribosome-binding protein
MPKGKSKDGGRDFADDGSDHDVHHREYVSHMSSFEMRDNEDQQAYQRRRDMHRANFLMCERRHDEDDTSFRQRLDDMTDKFREKRRAWSDSAGQAGSNVSLKAQQTARQASDRTQELFANNPLVGGILAAAVGAALGSTIPVSRTEQEKLGEIGGKARDMANDGKEALTSQVREKKDDLLEQADQKLQHSPGEQPAPSFGEQAASGGDQFTQQSPFGTSGV